MGYGVELSMGTHNGLVESLHEVGKNEKTFILRDEGYEFVFQKFCETHKIEKKSKENTWDFFINGLNKCLRTAFNKDVRISIYKANELQNEIEKNFIGNSFIVSQDPCFYGEGISSLGVSREFGPGGLTEKGITNRPGYPPLKDQMKTIYNTCDGENVTLIEDDIFSGATVSRIVSMMNKENIKVKDIVSGFKVGTPISIINKNIPIKTVYSYDEQSVVDLSDPRDYFFGSWESGLVINDGKNIYRAPYTYPWVNPSERASIPENEASKFSENIIKLNLETYELLEADGHTITFEDTNVYFQKAIRNSYKNISVGYPITNICSQLMDDFQTLSEKYFGDGL